MTCMLKIVFLIDDDPDDREFFEEAIHAWNAATEVCFARDGVEGLEVLNGGKIQPDVIFLDYNMPRMNGVQCLHQLKASHKTRDIPVIMYTTSGNRTDEEGILLIGADYYMQKTWSFNQLCGELERLLLQVEQKLQSNLKYRDGQANVPDTNEETYPR